MFSRFVGIMLPSSPLHALLMDVWGKPLVVTSGNLSGEPLCISVEGGWRNWAMWRMCFWCMTVR
ncbi:hypothetical protein EYB66_05890 [Akkermansia muciniphila]|uniref:Sua5/YciO/YrdC/YwlC family protein n=1 Tax=Akkermansia muciniphila TaxID=239935 RepID=UPI0010349953|nr:Sua5/YciO/YrdC/YwlC family protein [Akkermansia muciniphila]QBH16830.1 hypothetical protein EYB66_05890 [Akkermansia muciniphila]